MTDVKIDINEALESAFKKGLQIGHMAEKNKSLKKEVELRSEISRLYEVINSLKKSIQKFKEL